MELKNYQRAVIRDLERYLEILMQTGSIETAYRRLWEEKHVPVGPGGMPRYQDLLPGVANVCLKVPTGGGKTFLAANAIEPIFHALGVMQQRVVVWLVPSDAILTQTLAALRNPAHPYRQKIDVAFNSRVEIYTKDQLLSATRFNISAITEQLSILVLSYDSFRGKKEQLKARQENSSLAQLAQALGTPTHPVEDMSYVLTSSADFKHTLDGIVKGLNNAGFTDQDYRAQEETPVPAPLPAAQQTTFIVTPPVPAEEPQDIFDDPDTVRLDPVCVNSTTEPQKIAPAVQNILAQAGKEIVAFETALQQHKDDPASDLPQEAQKMVGQTKVKAEFADEIEQLILPKFCLKIPQSILMPSDTQELTKENLLSNFTLKGKPSNIDFDHLDNNLAQVDLDGDGTPRASKMESQYQQFIGQQFPLMPGENRLKLCRNIIHTTLSRQKKLNAVDDTELQRYVDYIIDGMNQDQLDALEQMPVNFANKICDYIIKLQEETARENFYNWLEVGKIVTEPRFKLTSHITLSGKASSLTKSLYKQECELDDNFEYDMAMALTGIDSVRWWHRNPTSGRNAFCLNAFRNHYPDFIVMTNSGKVLLVETKGDQLENAESREKIKLGRAWQNAAGSQYRYYMVFQNKDLHLEGAYRFDEFLKILGEL